MQIALVGQCDGGHMMTLGPRDDGWDRKRRVEERKVTAHTQRNVGLGNNRRGVDANHEPVFAGYGRIGLYRLTESKIVTAQKDAAPVRVPKLIHRIGQPPPRLLLLRGTLQPQFRTKPAIIDIR